MTALVDSIPLTKDAHGVYRVGGSRVTLDLVVRAFNRGATAEEIVQKFSSLNLSDVYQVIGYYLKHSAEFAGYFEQRKQEERELLVAHPEWSPKGLRERLLARREARLECGKAKPRIDRGIAEGLEDIREGRVYGPYHSAAEALSAFRKRRI